MSLYTCDRCGNETDGIRNDTDCHYIWICGDCGNTLDVA